MLFIHRTSEGEEMLLSQMDDSHLQNTCMLLLRKLAIAKDVLTKKATDRFTQLLEGEEPGMSQSAAEHFIEAVFNIKFPFYFLELAVRNVDISEVLTAYQKILGRETKRERFGEMWQLLDKNSNDSIPFF